MSVASHERDGATSNRVFGGGMVMPGSLDLQVRSGSHAGAVFPIKGSALTLGSSLDNDVVLFAADLAPHHARIEVVNRMMGKVRVTAVDEPVLVEGQRWVEVGHSFQARAPMNLTIGGVELTINAPSNWMGPLKVLGGLGLLGLLLGFGVPALQRSMTPSMTTLATYTSNQPAAPDFDKNALAALQARVNQAGLSGLVGIKEGNSGSIVASGTVDDGRIDRWRDIVKWYDMQPRVPLLVNNVGRSNAAAGPQGIKSIWFDKKPQVMLVNGQVAGIGDTIPGGWKIDAIEQSGVTLSRDGMQQKISF